MLIRMENVCKDYLQGKESVRILKNVNFTVDEGEYVAVMGPSGSGKTTLMNILGCLDRPTSGAYELDGQNVGTLSEDRLTEIRNREIGFVFQSFYLLPNLSALENAALPLIYAGVKKRERLGRAEKALRELGLGERLHFMPNQLSGGQQQRVAIARAMIANPRVLFADEPTGALDTASGEQIMEVFQKLNDNGAAIVMITHERAIAEHAKRICFIRDGRLSETEAGANA